MKFIEASADLPNELIREINDGGYRVITRVRLGS
jgi:hypothetical protein